MKKINGRLDIAEAKIYIEDKAIEIICTETQGKNQAEKKSKYNSSELCANLKQSSTLGKERERKYICRNH